MARKYQAYSLYKDSGLEFYGEIPEHWHIEKIKYNSYVKGRQGWQNLRSDEYQDNGPYLVTGAHFDKRGGVDWEQCHHISEERFNRDGDIWINQRDVLITKDGTIGKVAFIESLPYKACLNSHLLIIRDLFSNYEQRFLYHLLCSSAFKGFIPTKQTGTTFMGITQEAIEEFPLILPSLKEQQKIAAFIDHETTKIDTLIAKQQELITLLKEKRQAVISHTVTKGLNPDVPMRDSGVVWLGDVPVHWNVCAIKYQLSSLDYKRIPLSGEERSIRSGEFRYYGASGVIDYIDDFIFDEPTVLVGEDGANLVNRNSPLAFSAYGKYWVNNHAHILKPADGLADYWAEVIEHIDINPLVSGSAQPKLTAENLNNLKISFPPSVEERVELGNFIALVKTKFDILVDKVQEQISLLKERRTALISAAVTGKIDVRNWQATA